MSQIVPPVPYPYMNPHTDAVATQHAAIKINIAGLRSAAENVVEQNALVSCPEVLRLFAGVSFAVPERSRRTGDMSACIPFAARRRGK